MMGVVMNARLLLLIIPISIAVSILLLFLYLSGKAVKEGKLRIETSHEASVFVDSNLKGRAPFEELLSAKEYTIKIVPESQLDKLVTWQGKITVYAGRLTYVRVDLATSELFTAVDTVWLEKTSGNASEITVISVPDGANVKIDDVDQGTTPLSVRNISVGDHIVLVSSSGFVSRIVKVRTSPGYRINTSVKLSMLPAGSTQIVPTSITPTVTPGVAGLQSTKKIIIKDTPTGFLRVRSSPSKDATESGKVKPKDIYTVIEQKDDWYKIEYITGSVGWVSGQYVQLEQ
jgi:uncharacterized protein YgiM (DUF1202 family)